MLLTKGKGVLRNMQRKDVEEIRHSQGSVPFTDLFAEGIIPRRKKKKLLTGKKQRKDRRASPSKVWGERGNGEGTFKAESRLCWGGARKRGGNLLNGKRKTCSKKKNKKKKKKKKKQHTPKVTKGREIPPETSAEKVATGLMYSPRLRTNSVRERKTTRGRSSEGCAKPDNHRAHSSRDG